MSVRPVRMSLSKGCSDIWSRYLPTTSFVGVILHWNPFCDSNFRIHHPWSPSSMLQMQHGLQLVNMRKTSWWYALNVFLILLDVWFVCLLIVASWRWSHIPWRFVLRLDFGWFLSNIVSHIFLSLCVDNNDCTDVLWISGLKTFGRHQNNLRGQHFDLVEGWKMNKYIREIDGNDEMGCPFCGGRKVLDMKYHWFMMSFPCRSHKFPGTETLRREQIRNHFKTSSEFG